MQIKNHAGAWVVALCAIILSGCGKEELLDSRNAEIVNGKVYADGSNKPFSGKFTNLNYREAPNLSFVMDSYSATAHTATNITTKWLGVKCDVQVKEGIFNGPGICKLPNSDILFSEFTYKNGELDGEVQFYDQTKDNRTLAAGNLSDGVFDGAQKIFNPESKKLVMRIDWKNGKKEGLIEQYTPDGKTLVYKSEWQNGKRNGTEESYNTDNGKLLTHEQWKDDAHFGEIRKYSPDGGTLIYKLNTYNNLKDGMEEEYDPQTGKVIGHGEWKMGVPNGVFQRRDASGNLIIDQRYENGTLVSNVLQDKQIKEASSSSSSTQACVDQRVKEHRRQSGAEALISVPQLEEWETICSPAKALDGR